MNYENGNLSSVGFSFFRCKPWNVLLISQISSLLISISIGIRRKTSTTKSSRMCWQLGLIWSNPLGEQYGYPNYEAELEDDQSVLEDVQAKLKTMRRSRSEVDKKEVISLMSETFALRRQQILVDGREPEEILQEWPFLRDVSFLQNFVYLFQWCYFACWYTQRLPGSFCHVAFIPVVTLSLSLFQFTTRPFKSSIGNNFIS